MKERERVLDLVKKGVLTTEEALVLLENMATEKDEKIIEKEASEVEKPIARLKPKVIPPIHKQEQTEHPYKDPGAAENQEASNEDYTNAFQEQEEKDRRRLEKILEDLAMEANQTSAELDQVNAELESLAEDLKEIKDQITVINTLEELEALSEEKLAERDQLEKDCAELEEKMQPLNERRLELEEELKDIRKEQREETWVNWSSKFDIPDDWKDTASETFTQVSEKVGEAGSQLGRFLKKTLSSVADTVNDNVDWKDVNLKVPGVASTKFEHEFLYPQNQATLLNVKIANGEVNFKTWDQEDLKVEAKIKLYGKMEGDTPFEAFLERSEIDVDNEKISFQIPNKRIKADLTFYLPKRSYDHISVKLLNGNISFEDIEAKDIYSKSTNGNMQFQDLSATMLEVEGVNGNMKVSDSQILDFLAESVNGDIILKGEVHNSSASIINGDIKISPLKAGLAKIDASSVNGSVKVALPKDVGIEGLAKTNLGNINSRIEDYEVVREKKDRTNQMLQFRRLSDDQTVSVKLSTATGAIYLKDGE